MSAASTASPRKLKILMLHGYTQSGALFHAKTRALEKALTKAFPPIVAAKPAPPGSLPAYPGGVQLFYPTGPKRLRPSDIPGFKPSSSSADVNDEAAQSESDTWGWWTRDSGTGEYTGLELGLQVIAETIREAGGVDGVIGFSQGACAAAFVASLLEPGRQEAFSKLSKQNGGLGINYPSAFLSPGTLEPINPPLSFAVSYAGFFAPNPIYAAFYEPKIKTPFLNVVGSLDSVVEEDRSSKLIKSCETERVVYHPGGHFVPIGKDMAGALIGFIREMCTGKVDDIAEDMDVPF